MLVVGSLIFALSINIFIIPNHLGEGGVTGMTIILYYLYEWSPGLVSLIANAILIALSVKILDKKTALYTIVSVVCLSFFLDLTHTYNFVTEQTIASAVAAGILSGVGIGLVLKVGGTTAGSAILARIANKYLGWSISYSMLFFDVVVVLFSYFIIGIENTIFTMIMLFIGARVLDFVIEGTDVKKAVTIITDQPDQIANEINHSLHRGVTVLTGVGFYSKNEKKILYIILRKREIIELKKIIQSIDQEAFVTVHNVNDVFGKGFLNLSKS